MTWVNLDDRMFEHPKIIGLSDGAFRLHLCAIGYANRFLTDGTIAAETVARLVPKYRKAHLDELLKRGLWTEALNGYEIHDYLDWNKSRAEVEEHRTRLSKVRSEAGKRGADRRWHQ